MRQVLMISTFAFLTFVTRYFIAGAQPREESIFATELENVEIKRKEQEEKQSEVKRAEIDTMLKDAAKALNAKKYDDAKKEYNGVLTKDEENIEALSALGALLLLEENFSMAVNVLEKAHRINPLEPSILSNLGLAHYGGNKYDDAIDAFEHSLALDDSNAKRHFNLAQAYREAGSMKKFVNEMKKTISIDPQEKYLDLLTAHLIQEKEYTSASKILKEALENDPKNSRIKKHLARVESLIK